MKNLLQIIRRHVLSVDGRYLGKWLIIGGLVGVVAGLGSIAFFAAISWATHFFLGLGAGYVPPSPAGEGQTVISEIAQRWMIPIITTVGGLISGLIVYKLAPEAEGHGTDAAIEAFHQKEGLIRARIPIIKLIASAITIGSGGSAGREGPTAQIAAGFGSLLGKFLKLSVRDRRIALAAGIGAGIGSIFKAPLGGALLSTEVLYLQGFEIEALVPSLIASEVGYLIYAGWSGYTPIFGTQISAFNDPYSILFYAVLGVVCGVVGIVYPRVFYGVRDFFRSLHIPNYYKPAIGGLAVGIMGLFLPQVLGMGYGWLQIVMQPATILPVGLMIGLAFAKIVATSLSIGSGGSGGVFAPGLFIGGMLGASLWSVLHNFTTHLSASPESMVVVGMMALFAGVARAPLAVMLMVAEMTGNYTMMVPAMVAVGISYVIVGRNTIYESQVESPAASPAHRYEYSYPLLQQLRVRDAMSGKFQLIHADDKVKKAQDMLQNKRVKALPVVGHNGDNNVIGIVALKDILRVGPDMMDKTAVSEIMTTKVIFARPDEPLDTALTRMTDNDISSLPVVENGATSKPIGMISRSDIPRAYGQACTINRQFLKGEVARKGNQNEN
jgi:CIC family chloride channel protein